jgi:hypothetical protein
MEFGLWPATGKDPETVATFEALRTAHVLSLAGRLPPTDFYQTLVWLTDGERLETIPVSSLFHDPTPSQIALQDRLQQFMNMLRQWRNIKSYKRFGRGHHDHGIDTTQQGELTVQCRACPLEGINLPPDWKNLPDSYVILPLVSLCLTCTGGNSQFFWLSMPTSSKRHVSGQTTIRTPHWHLAAASRLT